MKYPSSGLQQSNLIISLILLTTLFKHSNLIISILFKHTNCPLGIFAYNKLFKPVIQKSALEVKL